MAGGSDLTLVLAAAAVVLIVVHFVLDAGPEKEAPGWILYAAIVSGVAGPFSAR